MAAAQLSRDATKVKVGRRCCYYAATLGRRGERRFAIRVIVYYSQRGSGDADSMTASDTSPVGCVAFAINVSPLFMAPLAHSGDGEGHSGKFAAH